MKNNKFILFVLMFVMMFSLQGCSFSFNKNNNSKNQTPAVKKIKEIDYVKEVAKNTNDVDNACNIYKERVNSEIEQYKERTGKVTETKEEFKLIGIFKSITLDKCFYVLENSYTNNGNKVIDYIINNAQIEETIDIFNNVDYKFLNERIKELQK